MLFFISDLHLGHKNIINYCERPFDNIHDMDKMIIDAINSTVTMTDELYILGDFSFKGDKPQHYRSQINCNNVHIILGNHDRPQNFTQHDSGFATVNYVKEIIFHKQKIFMSHYPHRSWPSSHRGSWMLYGHTHANLNHQDITSPLKTLDVGVDNLINYNKPFGQPWSFIELQELFNTKQNLYYQ